MWNVSRRTSKNVHVWAGIISRSIDIRHAWPLHLSVNNSRHRINHRYCCFVVLHNTAAAATPGAVHLWQRNTRRIPRRSALYRYAAFALCRDARRCFNRKRVLQNCWAVYMVFRGTVSKVDETHMTVAWRSCFVATDKETCLGWRRFTALVYLSRSMNVFRMTTIRSLFGKTQQTFTALFQSI